MGRYRVNIGVNGTYWKNTLRVTLYPFMLWGIPTNKLFIEKEVNSTGEWLKTVAKCSNICTSAWLFFISAAINIYVFYSIGNLFYECVIIANPGEGVISNISDLLLLGPVVIPIIYVWLYGFKIRNLIESFDTISIPVPHEYHVNLPVQVSTRPSGRSTLYTMYFIIFAMFSVKFTLLHFRINEDNTSWADELDTVFQSVFYTLMFPVYAAFCGAVTHEFQMLFSYINNLMNVQQPVQAIHLNELKRAYKIIADQILQINGHCSLYLSWVLLVCYLGLNAEARDLISKVIDILGDEDIDHRSYHIRTLLADVFVILSTAGLGYMSICQAMRTNSEARYLNVWLNDFATTPNAKLSTEIYQSVSV